MSRLETGCFQRLLLLPIVLLALFAWIACNAGSIPDASWISVSCNQSEWGPAVCVCQKASRSETRCQLQPGTLVPPGLLSCISIMPKKLSSLSIDCGQYSDCATVSLSQLVYRSELLQLELSHCGLDAADEVNPPGGTQFALIADEAIGISAGSAGFLSNSPVDNPSARRDATHYGCSLRRLKIVEADLKFPTVLVQKCPSLNSINISKSRLRDLTDLDVLAISSAAEVILSGDELFYFGDSLVTKAFDGMNQQPLATQCVRKRCSNFTTKAKALIEQMVVKNGAVTDARKLYYMMETENIDFRLILGRTEGELHVAGPLSTLDLSNNRLSVIPSSLSMMSNLILLNLSRNRIDNIYHESGCWGGPASGVPLLPEQKTKRQCYWFWASRKTLHILDLSHNFIYYLGQVEPWYEVDLWILHLSYNRIAVMGADSFTGSLASNLRYLYINNNFLQTIQLNSLRQLSKLNANNNRLACIKNDTLPHSENMRLIELANNEISSISPFVFKQYKMLKILDLSNNRLEYMPYSSFETSLRHAASDRVELLIDNQKVVPVCNCKHFFFYAMQQEQNDDNLFTLPSLQNRYAKTLKCRLIPKSANGSNITKHLAAMNLEDFGCQLHDYGNIELPLSICKRKSGHCIGRCNPGCYCWTNAISTIMNCSVEGMTLSAKSIPMPVTELDFSFVTTSYFHALHRNTLSWLIDEDRHALRVLRATHNNIVSIKDYAFTTTPLLNKLFLSHNSIKTLTSQTFAGLESTLCQLELDHNSLSSISVSQVLEPLQSLAKVTLLGNPFECSCSGVHLSYMKSMADYYKIKSVIQDYRQLTCNLTSSFVKDFNYYNLSSTYSNISLTRFPLQSVSLLEAVCDEISDLKSQLKVKILHTSLITLGIAAGLIALGFLMRRRHFIISIITFSLLIHVMRPRRCRNVKLYHAFFYFDNENDSEAAEDILKHIINPPVEFPNSKEIKVCTCAELATSYDNEGPVQRTDFESIETGVAESFKVLLLLSTGLIQKKGKEIAGIMNLLGHRGMAQDLILITVDKKDELELQLSRVQETIRSAQERKGMEALLWLAARRQIIRYGSQDWQYRLMTSIMGDFPQVSSHRQNVFPTPSERDLPLSTESSSGAQQMTEHSHLLGSTRTPLTTREFYDDDVGSC